MNFGGSNGWKDFGGLTDGWMDSKGFEYIYMSLLWGGKDHGVEI